MRCRPSLLLLLASVSLFSLAAGCGENSQTAFLWDHDVSVEPSVAEPDAAPEPGPAAEPDPEPSSAVFDVERWGVITGGQVQCADAAPDREATHLVFGDANDLLVLELGPEFDLRWDFALRGSGVRPVCASGLGRSSFRVARFNENLGNFGLIDFDAEGGGNERGPITAPPLQFLDAELMLSLDEEVGIEGLSLVTGFGAPDFGPAGLGTSLMTELGVEDSAVTFADSYERQIGAVFDVNFSEVIFAYSSFGTVSVALSRFPEDFGEPLALTVLDIAFDPFETDLGNRNRLVMDDASTLWLAVEDRLISLERDNLEPQDEYTLDEGAEAVAIVAIDSALYIAATVGDRAVVYRFRPNRDDRPTIAYEVTETAARAFDLKRGQDDALHFIWVDIQTGAGSTTVDVLTPR